MTPRSGALRYFGRIKNGTTPASGEAEYWNGDIKWATPEDLGKLTGDRISDTKRKVTEKAVAESNLNVLPAGAVIISTRAPIGHMAINSEPMAFNQGCRGIIPGDDVHGPFLFYLLKSRTLELNAIANGTTFVELSRDELAAVQIELPPLENQQRISRLLDEKTARIDGLIEKKRTLLERLAEKRQALITRAVTKGLNPDAPMKPSHIDWLGDIPEHWDLVPLKRLGKVRSGITKGKHYINEQTSVLPYLRVANVQDGWLNLEEIAEIEVKDSDIKRYSLKKGDILMNEGGDNDKLGRGTVWRSQIEPCLHQNHVFAVRLSRHDPEWVARCTEAAYAKFHFFRRAVQSTNLASISRGVVEDLVIPLPGSKEIAEILSSLTERLSILDRQTKMITSSSKLLHEYRAALITSAVAGKIEGLR